MTEAHSSPLPWSDGAAWIDGAYKPIADATISVLDWGFIHSDVVYDVVHVWDGAFFRLADHLDRFAESMAKTRLAPAESRAEIERILHGCVARLGQDHVEGRAYVAMVCTRGRLGKAGSRDPRDCVNRFFAYALPYIHVIPEEIVRRGARLYAPMDVRRIPSDSVDPTAKNYHWGDFTRALLAARDQGFDNALLLDHQGRVAEGPGFNAFAVIGDEVATPESGALMGVTRRAILELASEMGLRASERSIPFEEFLEADEIFIATTAGGVTPVIEVNDRRFSNGAPGPTTLALTEAYWAAHADPRHRTPVEEGGAA